MDSALEKIVDAVRSVEKQARDTAFARAGAHHDPVPRADEQHLLGALAGVVEVLRDVAGVYPGRMHTPTARTALHDATARLRDAALALRAAERNAAEGHA
ncbi:hypothetical protein [Kitasatospora sp. NPDC085879]|uniref:hypothetical protein n=1 Tax=Kitasatospora sp. NPDC085879 TaxID=3154769 RepID=UPI000BB0EE5D|nr:hypothetical protein [Streptomyces sp. TLI_235]PBC70628.1 hypothetical protein BX265_5176 [Streptomyces sp. TLI_235]